MLTSCGGTGKVYQNVSYAFNTETKAYDVYAGGNKKQVGVESVYYIYTDTYLTADNGQVLYNEYYETPNKLYVYNRK